MAEYRIYKETVLPGTLQPHSIYLVAPAARPDYVEMYVTGTLGTTVKRIIDKPDIEALITAALSGINQVQVVANIAARNALAPTSTVQVLVRDATADATVATGGATYIWDQANTTWVKIAEHATIDATLTWAGLSGKPTSAVGDIDNAVSLRHSHTNKTELDKVGESGGLMTYNGVLPSTGWNSTGW